MNEIIPVLFILSGFLILAVIGIVGNLIIVYITALSKELRNPCNIFIAVNAFCCIFHQLSHVFPAYFLLSGNYHTTSLTCLKMQAFSNVCMNFSAFLILTIGCDRLLIVFVPLRYNRFSRSPYVVLMLIPPAAYSAMLLFLATFEVHVAPTEPVLCIIVAIYLGFTAIAFTASDSLINVFVIIVYFVMWLKLRSNLSTSSDKLLKPLLIIGFFAAFNWTLSTCAMGISYGLHLTEMQEYGLKLLAGVSINIEMAFNFPIFYVLSDSYRSAFWKIFGKKRFTFETIRRTQNTQV